MGKSEDGWVEKRRRLTISEQNSKQKRMQIQLVWESDPSVDGGGDAVSRWREYVDSYVMNYPTEWLPQEGAEEGRSPVYLRR